MNEFYTFEQMEADHQILHNTPFNHNPDEPSARYQLLKNYYAKFFFYEYKMDYASYAIKDDDIEALKGTRSELEKMKFHVLIDEGSASRNELYVQAQRLLASYRDGNEAITTYYDYKTSVLMLIVLHDNKYFETHFLHDDFFTIGTDNDIVARVYAEYFLFYDYVVDRLNELQPESEPVTTHREPETFEDLFRDKGIYKEVIDRLSKPLTERIAIAGEMIIGTKPLEVINNKIYWNINIKRKPIDRPEPFKKPASKSYLAGLYEACSNLKLIEKKEERVLLETAKKSFNLSMSRSAFSKLYSNTLDENYVKPFMLLLKDLQR